MKSRHQSGSAHLAIIIVIVLLIVGALGFVFWNNFINKSAPAATTSGTETASMAAPTFVREEDDTDTPYCTSAAEKDGSAYDLFADQKTLYTYTNANLGLSFSYPKNWGSVQVTTAEIPLCVGPIGFKFGTPGEYKQGDGEGLLTPHGYFQKSGKYFYNWFKDGENGPYAVGSPKVVQTINGEAIIIDTDTKSYYAVEMSINFDKPSRDGLGVIDQRLTKEGIAALKAYKEAAGIKTDKVKLTSDYTHSDVISELEKFASTVEVLK